MRATIEHPVLINESDPRVTDHGPEISRNLIRYSYCTKKYNFRSFVAKFLGIEELELLHISKPFKAMLTDSRGDAPDQGQELHRSFYNRMDSDLNFKSLYDDFILNVIKPHFDYPILFQKYPTFRIHQPNNICVFSWHKDKHFGHSMFEKNIFLPVTNAYSSNTIWAESREDRGDFAPMNCEKNQYIIWNGANCNHGNKLNTTQHTRVSFDFRVLNLEHYDQASQVASLTSQRKFKIGSYYDDKVV